MRPTYETEADLVAERATMDALLRVTEGDYTATKLGAFAPADFLIATQGVGCNVVEVKNRTNSMGAYPTYIISKGKIDRLVELGNLLGLPPMLLVGWSDQLGSVTVERLLGNATVRVGGRTDRGDAADIEELYEFPVADMHLWPLTTDTVGP